MSTIRQTVFLNGLKQKRPELSPNISRYHWLWQIGVSVKLAKARKSATIGSMAQSVKEHLTEILARPMGRATCASMLAHRRWLGSVSLGVTSPGSSARRRHCRLRRFGIFLLGEPLRNTREPNRPTALLLMVWFENQSIHGCRTKTCLAFRISFGDNPWVILR